MNVRTLTRGLCSATAAMTLTCAFATSATAETITVTDIAGRVVEVERDPSHVVIGEGRMIYSIALLDQENPSLSFFPFLRRMRTPSCKAQCPWFPRILPLFCAT